MAENVNTVLSKAMALCSRREFCLKDISSKLLLWNVGSTESEKILNILIKENFINESRYATAFVKDKFRYNKWGKVKISAHLKAKNISSDIIQTALDSIDNTCYIETLGKLLDSHRKTVKAKNQIELNAKLLRYGLSKGFESALLYDILNDMEY
jgi:regulatory protein